MVASWAAGRTPECIRTKLGGQIEVRPEENDPATVAVGNGEAHRPAPVRAHATALFGGPMQPGGRHLDTFAYPPLSRWIEPGMD